MTDFSRDIRDAPIDSAIAFILSQKDINITDIYGRTMLHCACYRKDGLPLVELLLYLGIDREKKTKKGYTALGFAKG
jgi:ankyrin repeat protein